MGCKSGGETQFGNGGGVSKRRGKGGQTIACLRKRRSQGALGGTG